MIKDVKVFLSHILQSIKNIEDDTKGFTFEKFKASRTVQDAVMRNLEIMGEAARNINLEFQKKNESIPWSNLIRMRDKLIHGYFGINVSIVWDVVKKDLPELKEKITKTLKKLS